MTLPRPCFALTLARPCRNAQATRLPWGGPPRKDNDLKKTRDYWFGIAISFLLAGLLAFLGGWAVITPDMGGARRPCWPTG